MKLWRKIFKEGPIERYENYVLEWKDTVYNDRPAEVGWVGETLIVKFKDTGEVIKLKK